MIAATTRPQPHSQRMCRPNDFAVHVNDVPASGATRLSSR
jgi:hypothetical protein